jgi:dUTPase
MIQFLKTKDYPVKDPSGKRGIDAGIDFYVPAYSDGFVKAFKEKNPDKEILQEEGTGKYYIAVPGNSDVNIPSGIYSKFAPNVALIGANKSGIATKKKLIFGAHVIDTSYQGIIHLHMINTSTEEQRIYLDEKIVQFVPYILDITPIKVFDENETSKDVFFPTQTDRGDKGFGEGTGLQ